MLKQHQVIALEKGVKSRVYSGLTEANKRIQKTDLFSGHSRRYTPKDESGEQLAPDKKIVQEKAETVLRDVQQILTELFDLTLTKDVGNQSAKADLIVDGTTLIKDAPATYLIFLEKQLVDLRTFIGNLPQLDPAEEWSFDKAKDCYVTQPSESLKTKKVARAFVKAEATERHPAQVEVVHEDITVGSWQTVKMSGSLPVARVRELNERADRLIKAVKIARESANSSEVADKKAGDVVLGFLFAPSK